MRVSVGYSENPNTAAAGVEAARNALDGDVPGRPCDMALLFSTAFHDPALLKKAVLSELGGAPRVIGGGAVGTITNDHYGYAGDQAGLALFWLDKVSCDILSQGGLRESEKAAGIELGRKLAALGTGRTSPVMLFYDAIDRTGGDVRLLMAEPLLNGIHEGLGFFPDLVGAGLQGDYLCTPIRQWDGTDLVEHHALAMKFGGDVRIDSVIFHGCKPATEYYAVTRAEGRTVLEINGRPALPFVKDILGAAIAPEEYPFFLTFGVNKGDKWGSFDEKNYANRLCFALDRKRDGIVMFEADMVEGTEFQIMYRSLNLKYIKPLIESVFANLRGRKPVFAFFIDCAGRAAGYSRIDFEDALIVQRVVAGRAPLLGIYSGVEIASVMGRPRPLDWTGVFTLFSVPE